MLDNPKLLQGYSCERKRRRGHTNGREVFRQLGQKRVGGGMKWSQREFSFREIILQRNVRLAYSTSITTFSVSESSALLSRWKIPKRLEECSETSWWMAEKARTYFAAFTYRGHAQGINPWRKSEDSRLVTISAVWISLHLSAIYIWTRRRAKICSFFGLQTDGPWEEFQLDRLRYSLEKIAK